MMYFLLVDTCVLMCVIYARTETHKYALARANLFSSHFTNARVRVMFESKKSFFPLTSCEKVDSVIFFHRKTFLKMNYVSLAPHRNEIFHCELFDWHQEEIFERHFSFENCQC